MESQRNSSAGSEFLFHVLTVSDTCSKEPEKDTAGSALADGLKKTFPGCQITSAIVPDDQGIIYDTILNQTDKIKANGVFTTGGTGFSPRDVTPEATRKLIEREAPAITTAMTIGSLKITPMAMLSRAVAGIRGQTLIVNFPGSLKAVQEIYPMIEPCLDHAVSLLVENTAGIQAEHLKIQKESEVSKKGHVCPHKSNWNDLSKVALRQRESPFPMLEVDKALELIKSSLSNESNKSSFVDLDQCLGYVLSENILAKEPLPPFPASIKDGYAVIASDGAGKRKVMGGIAAGSLEEIQLKPGFCARINTGAPLPSNADAVVQVEDTKLLASSDDGKEELEIEVLKAPKKGTDIRPIGYDIEAGQLVVKAKTTLQPGHIGVLATVGAVRVPVYLKPSVGILSTGDELQPPKEDLKPKRIRDSNKTMLTALLSDFGFDSAVDLGIARDDPDAMVTALKKGFESVDMVITTGSVSMGDKDLLKHILVNEFGATIHFGRVNMKPGKPTTFATCEYNGKRKYIFALPGNPVSAFVTCVLFVIPALKMCSGIQSKHRTMLVELVDSVVLDPRPEYARAHLLFSPNDPCPRAELLGSQASSRLLSTCHVDVLVLLPSSNSVGPILTSNTRLPAIIISDLRN